MNTSAVQEHFNGLANRYDAGKAHAWYYYKTLKDIASTYVPPGKSVLEVGCGTGDLLMAVQPACGVGFDVSERMIELAREKWRDRKSLSFFTSDLTTYQMDEQFDYLLFFDVIEHLTDQSGGIKQLGRIAKSGTVLLASMANPLWEPLLMLLEKLGLKMPEGPHYRLPLKEFKALLRESGFVIFKEGRRLFIPAYIPYVSPAINWLVERTPVLKELCLIQYMLCRKI